MAGDVIDLHTRAAHVPNLVLVTRTEFGLSREAFAAALTRYLPWPARAGHVKAWENGTELPGEVAEACRALIAGDDAPPGVSPTAPGDAADAMRQFRAADLQLGGGHMYPVVLRYLRGAVAPRLVADDGASVFTTASALSDMAGWMAHDAGHDDVARQHFRRARELVMVSGDRQVAAHVLASSGHLAHHVGEAAEAITASRTGLSALAGGPRVPGLEARLHAIGARGYSALGDRAAVTRALARAEQALAATADEPLTEWVSTFDEGTLAGEAARCLRATGQLAAAQRQAARVVELRPASRPRSRALGLFTTAQVALAQGRPDEGAIVATGILTMTGALGSYVVVRQFIQLAGQLAPYRSCTAVAEFLAQLGPALEDRMRLHSAFPGRPVVGLP